MTVARSLLLASFAIACGGDTKSTGEPALPVDSGGSGSGDDSGGSGDDSGGDDSGGDTGGDTGGDSGGDTGSGADGEWAVIGGIYGGQYVEGVAVAPTGDVVFGGSFENGIDLGDGGFASHGRDDLLVGVLAGGDGTLDWNVSTGDGGSDVVYDIAVAPDGAVYATGWFEDDLEFPDATLTSKGDYDGFVARWSADGTFDWAVQLGGTDDDRMRAVAADDSGVCVAGFTANGITGLGLPLSATSLLDGVVVCLSAAGTPEWGATFGFGGGTAPALAITLGPDAVVAGGYFTGELDLGAGRVASEGDRDGWVVQWARDGTAMTGLALGATGDQEVLGLAMTPSGPVAVGMWSGGALPWGDATTPQGSADGFVLRLSSGLVPEGAHLVGGDGEDEALDVAVGPSGELAVTGYADGTLELSSDHPPLGDRDLWLGILDASGWSASGRYGGAGEDVGRAVSWHPSGDLVVGGTSYGDITIGGTTLVGFGDRDFLLARVAL